MTRNEIDPTLAEAWNTSFLSELPDPVRTLLLEDAFLVTVPPGAAIYKAYGPPRFALMLNGLAKVKVVSPDGRVATLRYATTGQVIGLPATISAGSPVGSDAVTECDVAVFNVSLVRRLAMTDPRVAWLLARSLTDIVYEVVEFLSGNLFGSVRQRVCRHLLDLAQNSGDDILVQVDQQELADAIGSVREVVARTLRSLKDEGLIDRTSDGIRLLAPAELHGIASGD